MVLHISYNSLVGISTIGLNSQWFYVMEVRNNHCGFLFLLSPKTWKMSQLSFIDESGNLIGLNMMGVEETDLKLPLTTRTHEQFLINRSLFSSQRALRKHVSHP